MNRFVVVDLETTGNSPSKDQIIQVGAILVENNQIIKEYSSFVYTEEEIPPFIQNLTGITPNIIKDAPTIDEVITDVLPLLNQSVFVAHHASFDLGFIQKALDQLGYKPFSGLVIDTLDLSRMILPMAQSYKLTQITDELEILHDNPHRADDDAKATAELFIQLLEKLKELPLIFLQRLFEIVKETHKDFSELLKEIINDKYLSYNEESEDHYLIYNHFALQQVEAEEEETDNPEEYSNEDFETIFEENGLLNDKFPNFELREAQREMAWEVWNSFLEDKHLMVEAGTGTGKSLAYLIPSIFWAKEHDEKLVIATHTINLQEQLYQRDIPLLKEILPFPFKATILKGRNNYLCLRKFEQLVLNYNSIDANKEYAVDIAQLMTWVTLTNSGDIEEVNLSITGRNIWSQIKSDADSCLNKYCPWFRVCFYHRARQKAQDSDIIITNHSLLLTNLKTDHRILPAFKRLVIDEAHHFEEVAVKHLGYELNQFQMYSLLQRFYKDAKNGFLIQLMNELLISNDPDQVHVANKIQNDILPIITKIESILFDYFTILGDFVNQRIRNNEMGRKILRITEKILMVEEWSKIQEVMENLHVELTELSNLLEEAYIKIKDYEIEETITVDFNGHIKDLKNMIYTFLEWNNANDTNMVFWVETITKGRKAYSYLYASPIDIGPYVKEYLFDKLESIIFTSATLSVNGSFNYISKEFGYQKDDEELRRISLPSPFDYEEQSVLCIPKDAPSIQGVTEEDYIGHIANNIADIAVTLKGRTLVLFTSYSMLNKTYYLLKDLLEPLQIKVLGHGIDSNSRSKLTKRFSENKNTVLLGTNSFWEGVDVPGEALSALVIVRLPFTPPNNPIHEAKTEKLKKEKINSFMEYSVPQAVIRFKQGFGRLIRTKRDKGIVIVFDRRLVESRYGKAFIDSLPKVKIMYRPFKDIVNNVNKWLDF